MKSKKEKYELNKDSNSQATTPKRSCFSFIKNPFKKKGEIEKPIINLKYHKQTLEEIAEEFHTSLTEGLNKSHAKELLVKNGKNKITQNRQNPVLKIIGYFFSGFCILIWIAAIICILAWKPIGDPSDPTNLGLGVLLIVVIVLQAAFTAFQDWSSGRVMKSIKNMMPSTATVIREGKGSSTIWSKSACRYTNN